MSETPSVIILHGNDEFAIAAHIAKLCAGLGDPSTAELNIARFDGRTGLDSEALNTAINAAPFLAPHRVMVLAHPLAAFASASARKKFLELLDKAQPTTLIALVEYEELKRDHWLLKWALSRAETGTTPQAGPRAGVHVYNMPKRWEMPRWIESEAKKQDGKIDPDAAARLSEMVGEDTRIAAQELTKLLTYVNFERPIRLMDVDKVSIVSAQGSVFEMVDALGQNDGRKLSNCGAWSSASFACCCRRVKCWTNIPQTWIYRMRLGCAILWRRRSATRPDASQCLPWSPFITNCWKLMRGQKPARCRSTWRWIR